MKSTIKTVLMAGCMMAAAVAANAETLSANVDFGFKSGRASFAPGTYVITTLKGAAAQYVKVTEVTTKATALVVPLYKESTPVSERKASLTFACAESSGCVLSHFSEGYGSRWTMREATNSSGDRSKVAYINVPLRVAVGD